MAHAKAKILHFLQAPRNEKAYGWFVKTQTMARGTDNLPEYHGHTTYYAGSSGAREAI